jgi:hypothetical protein
MVVAGMVMTAMQWLAWVQFSGCGCPGHLDGKVQCEELKDARKIIPKLMNWKHNINILLIHNLYIIIIQAQKISPLI